VEGCAEARTIRPPRRSHCAPHTSPNTTRIDTHKPAAHPRTQLTAYYTHDKRYRRQIARSSCCSSWNCRPGHGKNTYLPGCRCCARACCPLCVACSLCLFGGRRGCLLSCDRHRCMCVRGTVPSILCFVSGPSRARGPVPRWESWKWMGYGREEKRVERDPARVQAIATWHQSGQTRDRP